MKTTIHFLLVAVMVGLLIACTKHDETIITNPVNQISFKLEQSHSSKDYTTHVKKIISTSKYKYWNFEDGIATHLSQEIKIDVELANGDTVQFGVWINKAEEDKDLLLLQDYDSTQMKNWDYISTEKEAANFYNGFDQAVISINNNGIYVNEFGDNFKITKILNAKVNGVEKSYIEMNFSGVAYGFYDPLGEYQEVYKITNGIFKGVIE